jgi:hypothetical protein
MQYTAFGQSGQAIGQNITRNGDFGEEFLKMTRAKS